MPAPETPNSADPISAASAPDAVVSLKEFKDGMAKVDAVLALFDQRPIFESALSDYLSEMRREVQVISYLRAGIVVVAALLILVLLSTLLYLVSHWPWWFAMQGQYVKATLVIGCIAGPVSICLIALKGTLRITSDRMKDDILPPAAKEIVDAVTEMSSAMKKLAAAKPGAQS